MEPKERNLFETMLKELIEDNNITERDVFRLAFMYICDGDPWRARDLKGKYLKRLGRENSLYDYFEGYMTALCDEVVVLGKKSLSSQAQATP